MNKLRFCPDCEDSVWPDDDNFCYTCHKNVISPCLYIPPKLAKDTNANSGNDKENQPE